MKNIVKFKQLLSAVGVIAAMGAASHAEAISITTPGFFLDVEANGANLENPFLSTIPTIPLSKTDTIVATDGTASTSGTYNFSNNPTNATFDFNFIQTLDGGLSSAAIGLMNFMLGETVNYSVSGSMSGIAKDLLDEFSFFFRLTPLGGGPTVDIINENDILQGTAVSHVLGDGMFDSGNNGPTSGVLTPGLYQIVYNLTLRDNISGFGGIIDGDMDSTGVISLQLTAQNAAVPEPSTFALTALGLLSLGLVGWRRRQR